MTPRARHEILVGLHVADEVSYQRYRERMTPMLEARGGFYRCDFRVSQTLKSESDKPVNRLFLISFPDRATKDAFFADPGYLAIRAAHFDGAVDSVQILADFDRTP